MRGPNPYTPNKVNLEMFFGRRDLATKMAKQLVQQKSFGVMGGRRMGKTTLLRQLEREIGDLSHQTEPIGKMVLPVYVDFQKIDKATMTFSNVQEFILKQVQDLLVKRGVQTISLPADKSFDDRLRHLLDAVPDSICFLVFLFDEMEIALSRELEGFAGYWRGLLTNTPGVTERISAVFAGAREMQKLAIDRSSPLWYALEDVVLLQSFKRDDVRQLLCEPCSCEWPDEFIAILHSYTGGHPHLLQHLMNQIYDDDWTQSLKACERACRTRRSTFASLFDGWRKTFGLSGLRLYQFISEQGRLSEPALLRQAGVFTPDAINDLKCLVYTGVVNQEDGDDEFYYQVSGSLFQRYLAQASQSIQDASELDYQLSAMFDNGQYGELEQECKKGLTANYANPDAVDLAKLYLRWLLKLAKRNTQWEHINNLYGTYQDLARFDEICYQIKRDAEAEQELQRKQVLINEISGTIIQCENYARMLVKWFFGADEEKLRVFLEQRPEAMRPNNEWFAKWQKQREDDRKAGKHLSHQSELWILEHSASLEHPRQIISWCREEIARKARYPKTVLAELATPEGLLNRDEMKRYRDENFHSHFVVYKVEDLQDIEAACKLAQRTFAKIYSLLSIDLHAIQAMPSPVSGDAAVACVRETNTAIPAATTNSHKSGQKKLEIGSKVRCKVLRIFDKKVLVSVAGVEKKCSIFIKEITGGQISDIHQYVSEGQDLDAIVLKYNELYGYDLSLRALSSAT